LEEGFPNNLIWDDCKLADFNHHYMVRHLDQVEYALATFEIDDQLVKLIYEENVAQDGFKFKEGHYLISLNDSNRLEFGPRQSSLNGKEWPEKAQGLTFPMGDPYVISQIPIRTHEHENELENEEQDWQGHLERYWPLYAISMGSVSGLVVIISCISFCCRRSLTMIINQRRDRRSGRRRPQARRGPPPIRGSVPLDVISSFW
jgi:hypothetical protein